MQDDVGGSPQSNSCERDTRQLPANNFPTSSNVSNSAGTTQCVVVAATGFDNLSSPLASEAPQ